MIDRDYNHEIKAEKLLWEAHACNKLIVFQKLVSRYEQIMCRADALVCAHRWLVRGLL